MLFLSLSSAGLLAQEEDATDGDLEFMALLEFIGEFTTEDGLWIDPLELEDEFPEALVDELDEGQGFEANEDEPPSQERAEALRENPDAALVAVVLRGIS